MRAEQHYDEEVLISFLASGQESITRDPHLGGCATCTETLDSFRLVADVLADEMVWMGPEFTEEPNADTIASLRAFADEMSREDAEAAPLIDALLATPRETWMSQLEHHPEWRTAGMVRGLVAATERVIAAMPPDGLELTALAANIVSLLPPSYSSETLGKLRGATWRQRAFALYYLGRFAEAAEALDVASNAYAAVTVADYDRARLNIVKTLTFRALGRDHEAMFAAKESVATFRGSGDLERLAAAYTVEAHMLMKVHDYRGALELLQFAERECFTAMHLEEQARLFANIATCYRKIGRFEEAMQHYELSRTVFGELGIVTEAVRVRMNIAQMLLDGGRLQHAEQHLRDVKDTFARLGMQSEAAFATLDICELLLVRERYEEVEELCRDISSYYENAGIAHGPFALTALAYMREAVRNRKATPELAREVRAYIRRLPAEPALLFAPSLDSR